MPKNTIVLLIVVALVAGSWPAVLLGGIELAAEGKACEDPGDACCGDEEADTGSPLEGDDCCSSGCNDCFLACCAGMVSLLPNLMVVPCNESTVSFLCRPHGDLSLACEREIDHPPQA